MSVFCKYGHTYRVIVHVYYITRRSKTRFGCATSHLLAVFMFDGTTSSYNFHGHSTNFFFYRIMIGESNNIDCYCPNRR